MASKDIRAKRIFISDIHMGDQQSVDPPADLHPYGWFHLDRGRMLADFLDLKLSDPEVKEIIILGDLFDLWVYPAELEPPDEKRHLCRIAHAYQNREVNGIS
jgi:UDP-2,3-diacylglucosamine pyrophosphatase LpxH